MVTNFKKKLKGGSARQTWLHVAGIAASAVLILLLYADYRLYQKKQEFFAQVSNLQSQVKSLQRSNSDLQAGISNQNDSQYIETAAREQLDLQKQGETVVSFVEPPAPVQKPANAGQTVWQNVASWIKNNF